MGFPNLLHHLRGAGLVLTLTPAGGLNVAPRDALTDDHRATIRAGRDALVLALQAERSSAPPPRHSGNPSMTPLRSGADFEPFAREGAREAFEERAGIREFDGGLHRPEAEQGAAADIGIRSACLTCGHRSALRTCLRPVEAGLTTGFEIVWCELLPESGCPAFEVKAA